MFDMSAQKRALEWVEDVLGSHVSSFQQLSGGLTSTMLAITDETGHHCVLRLMTHEPWRTHGPALTTRERAALQELAPTSVPAPVSLGLDAEGTNTGVAAHLMSRLQGEPGLELSTVSVRAMAETLVSIHDVAPSESFRAFQSWAPREKWRIPEWSQHQSSWQAAFDLLSRTPPEYEPAFLHRDFSHRNLLWHQGQISGVVDWVETSTGPAWLDAGHAATNLAVAFDADLAMAFVDSYSTSTNSRPGKYWLVMDAVGFLPIPGKRPLFGSVDQLTRLDRWLHVLVTELEPDCP